MSLDHSCLDPTDLGWGLSDGVYVPIKSCSECLPETLLKFVRCKFKHGCASSLSSCKKHRLSCVAACKNCHGDSKKTLVSFHTEKYV